MHTIQFIYTAPITDLLQRYNDPILEELYEVTEDYIQGIVDSFGTNEDILVESCLRFLRRVINDKSDTTPVNIINYLRSVIRTTKLEDLSEVLRVTLIRCLIIGDEFAKGNIKNDED
jgi:hypothetical protein